jgi:hypothetical protein
MFRGRVVQQIFAWTLLIILAVVCISPVVDLEACTLRTQNDASLLWWLLAAALVLQVLRVNVSVQSPCIRLTAVGGDITWIPPAFEIFTLASSWRV